VLAFGSRPYFDGPAPRPYPKTPLVPLAETVHERMSVEIFYCPV